MRSTTPEVRAPSTWTAIALLATLALVVLAVVVDSESSALFATLGIALMCRSLEPQLAHTARQRMWWRVVYLAIAVGAGLVVLLLN